MLNCTRFLQAESPAVMDLHTGDQKQNKTTRNLFLKNYVCIVTCVNFSHLPSALLLMQYTCGDVFSHCSVCELISFDAF